MGTEYTGGGEGSGPPPDGGLPRKKISVRYCATLVLTNWQAMHRFGISFVEQLHVLVLVLSINNL